MAYFESLCATLYGADPSSSQAPRQVSNAERKSANEQLNNFTEDVSNLGALKFFLEKSSSKYVQFVAASALKNLFTLNWSKIPVNEKLGIKDFLVNLLMQREASSDSQVVKMLIMLIAKVTKLSWFDHPDVQGVIQNLFDLQNMNNERLVLLSLTALHDIIIEMSYVNKVRNLNINRRISLSFRDGPLYRIFEQSLLQVDHFINQVQT